MRPYQSEFSLGPHRVEQKVLGGSFLKRVIRHMRNVMAHPHQVSSLVLLVALFSFTGNIAFAYFGFVNKGFAPEVGSLSIMDSIRQKLGSDDGGILGQPPLFTPSVHFKIITDPSPLSVSAESYIIADAVTGEIILEKNPDTQLPMASVSKIITAIVAKEQIDPRHSVEVTKESYNAYGTEGKLSIGEKVVVSDLYYPLLMESSNDAAEVFANDFGRDAFITLLNKKTIALGMYSTFYEDPSGLSPKNVSTAHDLTKLGIYVYAAYPEILDITRVKEYAIYKHLWKNENVFLTYPNFLGGKNGFTNESKKTTLSYFSVFFRGDDPNSKATERPLILILLRSNDRDKDAAALLSYAARNIRYVEEE